MRLTIEDHSGDGRKIAAGSVLPTWDNGKSFQWRYLRTRDDTKPEEVRVTIRKGDITVDIL